MATQPSKPHLPLYHSRSMLRPQPVLRCKLHLILLRSVRSNLAVAGLYQQRAALQMFIAQRSQLCQTHRPVPRDLPLSLVNGKRSPSSIRQPAKSPAQETQISPTERAILLEEAEDRVAASVLNPNSRMSRNLAQSTTTGRVR